MPKHNKPQHDIKSPRPRLDKWLWCARFYKTRAVSSDAIKHGRITLNDRRAKSSSTIKPGDVLEIRKKPYRYNITIVSLATARKSAIDAAKLYSESTESISNRGSVAAQLKLQGKLAPTNKGRPSKKNRRAIIRFKQT